MRLMGLEAIYRRPDTSQMTHSLSHKLRVFVFSEEHIHCLFLPFFSHYSSSGQRISKPLRLDGLGLTQLLVPKATSTFIHFRRQLA